MDENIKLEAINNFNSRNIDVTFSETLEKAKDRIIELISIDCSIGFGNLKLWKK